MEQTNEKYIQFPLFLLTDLHVNKADTINQIFKYGIYNYSTKFNVRPFDVAKQLVYDLYRGELSKDIKQQINALKSTTIGCNKDYNGFNADGTFEPTDEINVLLDHFAVDSRFYRNASEHYKLHLAYESLGISGNKQHCIKVAKEICNRIPKCEPMPMINTKFLFEFRDKDKSDFELIQLTAFIAIKSILGVKPYAKTNKAHIVSRMLGYSSIKHIPDTLKTKIRELLQKYSKRHHIDKLIKELEMNWNVVTYSKYNRGMYVAISKRVNIYELALIAESKKQKHKAEALKTTKNDARQKALQQLNKGQQLK